MKMNKVVLAVMVVLMAAGAAGAKDFEVTKKASDYSVLLKIDKNPPVTGNNNLAVVLKDAAGAAVQDAKVEVEYSMPAMPGMPAIKYKTNTELKGGEYRAKLNFSMSGPWSLIAKISHKGKMAQTKFTVDVR